MDIGSIGPVIVAAAAAGGLIFAVMKWPSERESLSAATHKDVIADMKLLNDVLVDELDRCRARIRELELERDRLQGETREMRSERVSLLARESLLEARLRALGQMP